MRVGLIGTGIMGGHIARRLAAAGLDVTVWNRTRDKAAIAGVAVADTVADALAGADAVIVMLSTAAVIEQVLFAAEARGLPAVAAMAAGSTLVVMSSVPVAACHSYAEWLPPGVAIVDAPVSGGEPGARDGTLAIMAGGEAAAIEALRPVFAALGRVTRIGALGTGQLAKLANQIIVGGTVAAVAEALHFARRGGCDPAAVRTALLGGFAESTILRQHGDRMVRQDFVPGGPAMYQLKDMRNAAEQAAGMGVALTVLPVVIAMFEALVAHGDGALDVSSIIREVERRAA